MTAYVFYNAKT